MKITPAYTAILMVLLAGVGGILGGLWISKLLFEPTSVPAANPRVLQSYPQPRVIADFSLYDQHGGEFSIARLKGRWHLVFLGYTHCPDICPTALNTLAEVMKTLRASVPERLLPALTCR